MSSNLSEITSPIIRLARYDDSTRVDEQRIEHSGISTFAGVEWTLSLTQRALNGPLQGQDIWLNCALTGKDQKAEQVGFALEFPIDSWTPQHYFVIPAGAYDGNRFACRPQAGYPPIAAKTGDSGPDVPTLIGDIPRMPENEVGGFLQLLSADCSVPAIGFYDPHRQLGMWLITPQATRFGNTGLDVEIDSNGNRAVLRISAPGIREGTRYHCFQTDRPSPDRAPNWCEWEAALLQVRSYIFPCTSRAGLYEVLNQIRSEISAPSLPRTPFALSSAARLIEEKTNRDNWSASANLYSLGPVTEERPMHWQSGWVGGAIVNYPLIVDGDHLTSERATRTLDWVCENAISSSGFFKSLYDQFEWLDDSFGHSKGQRWHMTRKSGDALLFLLKSIDWRDKHTQTPAPQLWRDAASRCADAFVRLWKKERQIGQFVDEDTGDLIVGGSDSAAITPAALCLASVVLNRPELGTAASEIGTYFWEKFSSQGYTTGGPGEILSAPDSESAFGLLESMVALMEAHDGEWTKRAEAVAAYCATWCVPYDFVFPTASTFGAMQMATTGTVIASVQNKHSSPGICTLSGDSLFRLFRKTGNSFYLNLAREIASALPQYVSREDRPILARYGKGPMPAGWICERVNMSDWLEPVGEIFYGPCWCEVSVLLSALELPTIYYQPENGSITALDAVNISVIEKSARAVKFAIHNPGNHAIQVRICVESTEQRQQALPLHAFTQWPTCSIAPQESIEHEILF
ncbi:MAG: hypothetical protein EAZ42_03100 [Verrucomicrobia bacterium]|nr:MAG: hypothetical protein EAZ42_03100 [Verrucomicrobiota bacterium]